MRTLTLIFAAFASIGAFAGSIKITCVTAQQRYPWNGKVDIVVTFSGSSNDVAEAVCSFTAKDSDTMEAIPVNTIVDAGKMSGSDMLWTRNFIWDSDEDFWGEVIDDVALTVSGVNMDELGGVQLWENGPYWAECNVGANQPEKYGYYFWWGDTVGYKRNSGFLSSDGEYYSYVGWMSSAGKTTSSSPFDFSNYATYDKDISVLKSLGYIDSTGNLAATYDAATVHLGSPWRMPTYAECLALISNCKTTRTMRNNVWGLLVTGRGLYSSKSIFLPAAGYCSGSYIFNFASHGEYWCSTPDSSKSDYAWCLYSYSDKCREQSFSRGYGLPVRPVRGNIVCIENDVTAHFGLDNQSGSRKCLAKNRCTLSADWAEDGAYAEVYIADMLTACRFSDAYRMNWDEQDSMLKLIYGDDFEFNFVNPRDVVIDKDTFEWGPLVYPADSQLELRIYDSSGRLISSERCSYYCSHENRYFVQEQSPTCTTAGWKEWHCSFCEMSGSEYIASALGHDTYVSKMAQAATCTAAGWTAEEKCSRCGEVVTASTTIQALGHNKYTSKAAQAATCTAAGWTAEEKCSRCGVVLTASKTLNALGHSKYTSKAAQAATCTAAGWTAEEKCSRCGEVVTASTSIPALGHDKYVSKAAKVPTCLEEGWTVEERCSRCGVVLTASEAIAISETWKDGYLFRDGYGCLYSYNQSALNTITVPDSCYEIHDGALENCRKLTSLDLSGATGLRRIGKAALKGCTELRTLVLPPNLEEIDDEAFMGCSYLSNVIIPASVRRVGKRAFKNCTGFTYAQIQYGVQALDDEAFYGDWQISQVDIPSTVTNIGVNAFGGDSKMIRASLNGGIRTLAKIFSNYALMREVTIKGDYVVDWFCAGCSELKDVHFLGNCPELQNKGNHLYECCDDDLVTYVSEDSTGWDGTEGSHALPMAWPVIGINTNRRSIAYWDIPTYQVGFDSNGGSLGTQVTYQKSEEHFVLPPTPTQTGYTFNGWWTSPVGGWQVTGNTIFIEGVYQRLYAHWYKGHYIFLDPNGGYVVSDTIEYIDQTVYGVLPTPTRAGYSFGGWWYYVDDDKYSTGREITEETSIYTDADHTLYAQWTAYKYSVKFDANGGAGDGIADQEFTYDTLQSVNKNTFTRSGYTFLGWSTDKNAKVAMYKDGERIGNLSALKNATVTLYAIWAMVDNAYVVYFAPGDGSGTMDAITCERDKVYKLPDSLFTAPSTAVGGRRSTGWWCEETNRRYDPGMLFFNLVPAGSTATMTAIWE